jgi:hypothetical protein
MTAIYVDDCGIAASDKKHIDGLITGLQAQGQAQGFILHKEGTLKEFLGISIDGRPYWMHPHDTKGSD